MFHYEIVRVLGAGNFGITYQAYSHRFHESCVIKELLPADYATRSRATQEIVPLSTAAIETLDHCRRDFNREASILHQVKHPNVVRILDVFDCNGTSYYVMPYAQGETLDVYLKRRKAQGPIPESRLLAILHAILDGLECIHGHGYLHRDLKPENILITAESGSPLLIDFGAARQLIGSRSRPMSAILTRGYAPPEQYSVTQNQGPYTDIYAMGAVLHEVITGAVPPDAMDRMYTDTYQVLSRREHRGPYSERLSHAIDCALRVTTKDRPQSIQEWRTHLPGAAAPPPPSVKLKTELPPPLPPNSKPAEKTIARPGTVPARQHSIQLPPPGPPPIPGGMDSLPAPAEDAARPRSLALPLFLAAVAFFGIFLLIFIFLKLLSQ